MEPTRLEILIALMQLDVEQRELTDSVVLPTELKILELKRTCYCCPDQYEACLADGRMLYIRLRNGYIEVNISLNPTNDVREAVRGPFLIGKELDQAIVNRTELKDLFQEFRIFVDWSECEYIDPYRLPPVWNYSLIGGVTNKIWIFSLKYRMFWRNLKQDIIRSSSLLPRHKLLIRARLNTI